ncbi:hypothetical protein L195_g028022, partial [Trifolium pratense]
VTCGSNIDKDGRESTTVESPHCRYRSKGCYGAIGGATVANNF